MSSIDTIDIQHIVSGLLEGRSHRSYENVDNGVAAVIAVENDPRFFSDTFRAVLEQSVVPGTIVVADCTGGTSQPVRSSLSVRVDDPVDGSKALVSSMDIQIVRATDARSFSDAVDRALQYARIDDGIRALWLLHDDSRPADSKCLEELTEAWHNTSTVSILGSKQLDWSGENLHNVGYYAGRHRLASLVVDDEPDQEQYDMRSDVYAVSLAGALVPLSTLKMTNGINSWFGSMGESADFCRRICLSGGRVAVVPNAVIAHRRARYEGVRSRSGEPVDEPAPLDSSMEGFRSAARYLYTDIKRPLWPVMWLFQLIGALIGAFHELVSKRPYRAWCSLCMPWYMLSALIPALKARSMVSSQASVPLSKLETLRASMAQMRQWRQRCAAFESQRNSILLSPLAKSHLRSRLARRWSGATAMAVAAFLSVAVVYWNVFESVVSGASVYSQNLLPSAVSYGDLFSSATMPWAFGIGAGVSSPPSPWLLIWLVFSTLTLGHPAVALSILFFAAAPVSAFSFWALAGVFTRSNAVRISSGLLWVALSWGMGLYGNADLPMLTVMMFLPAAFAFVFRAVGMYRTEDPVRPHSSVQMAACAALCFIPVVCAEPQLLLALVVAFLMFIVAVRSHRTMLLLIPFPAALALAPTLVNVVHYASKGLWRQMFSDAVAAGSGVGNGPAPLNLGDVVSRSFGMGYVNDAGAWSRSSPVAAVALLCVVVVAVLAAVSLVLPFALRVSRMMWALSMLGALLALVSVRVSVGMGDYAAQAGPALPGVALLMMGVIACVCQIAGAAVRQYRPIRVSQSDVAAASGASGMLEAADASDGTGKRGSRKAHTVAVHAGRVALTTVLLVVTVVWTASGIMTYRGEVSSSNGGLPMVAVDYLQHNSNHRILALRAESEDKVDYSVMRTRRGDLVDASPGFQAQRVSGIDTDSADDVLSRSVARLLAGSDSDSVKSISDLGFGGIYVVNGGSKAAKGPFEALTTNVNASDGVQALVEGDGGTYYQISTVDTARQGVHMPGEQHARTSPWRYAWLWCLAVVVLVYCLVAMPRIRRYRQEEA